MKKPSLIAMLLALILIHAPSAVACVGCREPGALTLDKESPTVLAGVAFSWSVLFMLCFVLLIVVGMSVYIWRTVQQLELGRTGQ